MLDDLGWGALPLPAVELATDGQALSEAELAAWQAARATSSPA